ncbi:hypothetical protein M1N05_01110 [Dehalococcoidales bacterium]|nr:hypothetical protein [Dehalococcoidales bacterium]
MTLVGIHGYRRVGEFDSQKGLNKLAICYFICCASLEVGQLALGKNVTTRLDKL